MLMLLSSLDYKAGSFFCKKYNPAVRGYRVLVVFTIEPIFLSSTTILNHYLNKRYVIIFTGFRKRLSNFQLEPSPGFEPGTPSLPWMCSTPELRWRNN